MDILQYLKELPEGSTLKFSNAGFEDLSVDIYEEERLDGSKDVLLVCERERSGEKGLEYNLKHLLGFSTLAIGWLNYRDDYFRYACRQNYDDRWTDAKFRSHMYAKYIATDRPITDQIFKLDAMNLRVLMGYIDEVLMSGINGERYIEF